MPTPETLADIMDEPKYADVPPEVKAELVIVSEHNTRLEAERDRLRDRLHEQSEEINQLRNRLVFLEGRMYEVADVARSAMTKSLSMSTARPKKAPAS